MSFDSTVSEEDTPSQSGVSRRSSTASSSSFFDSQDSAPTTFGLTKSALHVHGKKVTPLSAGSINTESKPTQWVMIMPKTVLDISNNAQQPHFINYPDPHTGQTRRYLLSHDEKTIYEINKSTDKYRSWFIGNTVQSDGSLYVCSRVDPLFLILAAILIPTRTPKLLDKYCTIDTILDYETNPQFRILEKLVGENQWANITDSKVAFNGDRVYLYSKDKTLNWLSKKVELLAETLKTQSIHVGSGSQSVNYVRSSKSSVSHNDYLHYASGMIQEYIPPSLANDLAVKFPGVANGKHVIDEDYPPAKRSRSESEPNEDYSKQITQKQIPVKTVTKMSLSHKVLSKVDKKGMKNLKNFFKKT